MDHKPRGQRGPEPYVQKPEEGRPAPPAGSAPLNGSIPPPSSEPVPSLFAKPSPEPAGKAPAVPTPAAPYRGKQRRHTRPIEVAFLAVSMALLVLVGVFTILLASIGSSISSLVTPTRRSVVPPNGTFSIIRIEGTIQTASSDSFGINNPSYHHNATVQYIKDLADDKGNKGILLYMNTGGGGVYESDEVYRALMSYKEKTSRPIWAYMGKTCASGGYYICMAADYIIANYGTITGSIGVYISLTDSSGLYDKLGLDAVLVRSGDNKGVGTQGVPITPENAAVYQSIVNEEYDRFVGLVVQGRHKSVEEAYALSDGRVYTAYQAVELGLVDELGEWEYARSSFEKLTDATGFTPVFSSTTVLGSLLSQIFAALPKSDAQATLEAVEELPYGVPMAYWTGWQGI